MPPEDPRFAVFGHPVAHSLSPRLQALFAAQTGIAMHYGAIDASPAVLAEVVRAFFAGGGRGANVTLPHKQAAFELADERTPRARRVGVANVLTVLPDGRLEADSNDGEGLLADLRARQGVDPAGRDVLLLGAGGAARAVAFELLDAGAGQLTIANRTRGRAQALAAALADPARVRVLDWAALAGEAPAALIINATSAGVREEPLALPKTLAGPGTRAQDLSYGASALPFLDWARGAGCGTACDGLGMLVETAAASFARWHGARPDADAALAALRTAGD